MTRTFIDYSETDFATNASAGTDATATLTIPAGTSAGDLLIVAIASSNEGVPGGPTQTISGTGWTDDSSWSGPQIPTDSNAPVIRCYHKYQPSQSPPASYTATVHVTGGTSRDAQCAVVVYRNVPNYTVAQINTVGGLGSAAVTGTSNPVVTSTATNNVGAVPVLLVRFWVSESGSNIVTTIAADGAETLRFQAQNTTHVAYQTLACTDEVYNNAAAFPSRTGTYTAVSNDQMAALSVLLAPTSDQTGPPDHWGVAG